MKTLQRKWIASTVVLFLYSVLVTVFLVVRLNDLQTAEDRNKETLSELTKLRAENESLRKSLREAVLKLQMQPWK